MRILVTGAGGQLGHDCAWVLAAEHELSCLGSRELDIGDRAAVRECVEALRPEVLINCAAYTAVDRCESETATCFRVNAEGPGHLAAAAAEAGARLLHISTDYVFAGDRPCEQAWVEDDPTGPVSAYGRAKLAGEQAVVARLDDHLIIRSAWLYGIDGRNFLKTILRLALADPDRVLRVVDDQVGSMTWTMRLAEQIAVLVDTPLRGLVHATAEGSGTWFQAAVRFLVAMGVPHRLEPCATADYPTPATRPANSILENARLKRHGLNRMRPWEEDVDAFAKRFRKRLLAEAQGQ